MISHRTLQHGCHSPRTCVSDGLLRNPCGALVQRGTYWRISEWITEARTSVSKRATIQSCSDNVTRPCHDQIIMACMARHVAEYLGSLTYVCMIKICPASYTQSPKVRCIGCWLLIFRTQLRGKVSTSSQTTCTSRCSRKTRNTAAPANHVITMSAATSTTVSTLKTT